MDNHKPSNRLAFSFGVVLLVLLMASPTWAEVICGATIGPSEVVTLTKDLSCFGFFPALRVEGGSILNLGGHSISCDILTNDGIYLMGGGSIIRNGIIESCRTAIRDIGREGGNLIEKVTARNNTGPVISIFSDNNELRQNVVKDVVSFSGYSIRGDHNTLRENLAEGGGLTAFIIFGDDNILRKNRAISTRSEDGFRVGGNRTQVIENFAKDNGNQDTDGGFRIVGSHIQLLNNRAVNNFGSGFRLLLGSFNTLLGNRSKENGDAGIKVEQGSINNQIVGNTAKRNTGTDLVDENINCDNNEWVGNRFRTSQTNPPDAGCIQ